MRANVLRQAVWGTLCALIVSGCAYEYPGLSLPVESKTLPPSSSAVATVPSAPPKPEQKPKVPSAAKPESDAVSTSDKNGNKREETDAGGDFDNLELDAGLKGSLTILRVGSEPTENNLLSVFVGLKNKTSHRLELEAQTIYTDKEGNPLNAGSWIPMTLKPHEEKEYRSASISTEAVDFLVHIRRAPEAGDKGAK